MAMRDKLQVLVIVMLSAAALGAAACSRDGAGAAAEKPAVAVDVATVTSGELVETVAVVGTLKPKREATIQSEYSGIVREVFVTEWVPVRRGQPLARLDSREAETTLESARAALLQAEVAARRAVREFERAEKLKAAGLETAQGVDDARTAREAADATVAAARAQLKAAETYAEKMVTRAPLDGVVSFRGISVGDRVENMGSGAPMFVIVDNSTFDLTVTVPSTRSAAVRVGQPLEFSTDALPGRSFRGTVKFINPTVSEVDRSVAVVAEVANPDGALRGGMFVKGEIQTGRRAGVLQMPRSALLSWDLAQGTGEVFVVNGSVAERRVVRTGGAAGELVEILAGVTGGEQVVTRGGFNLREGDRVTIARPQGA
jgi:RND family efflux transporter MFP subunit